MTIGGIYDDKAANVLEPTAPLSYFQVKSTVEAAIATLQSKGVMWNEILAAMEEMAFDQGNHPIADVLGAAAYHAWQAEAGKLNEVD